MNINNADSNRSAAPDTSNNPPFKRNRIQLSCTHCRHAKLKCDREKPCLQCIKRGRSSLCTFPSPTVRKRPAVSMQNRLRHLEGLVKGAMASQLSDEPQHLDAQGTPLPEKPVEIETSGRLVGPNDATYIGSTHWAAMLEDIEEVKVYFSENVEDISLGDESARPDISLLLNNTGRPSTYEDLLAALPERNIVNRLISRYFNSNSPALHIIHKPTFQKNYRKFWEDPHRSPITFLALLYCVMCLGTFFALGAEEETSNSSGTLPEMVQSYRQCCAQCLELSNYAKYPGPYTLETFLLYIESEFVLSQGNQMSCYLIVGVAVRLALRMGLHRDPDKVEGNITPYQGEIRRRIWHLLVQMDLLISFENGLPSMVQGVKSDTLVPLNLQDQDFDEGSTVLPPSRPESEMTGMSYALAKGRIARVFQKIVEQANLLTLPNYAEVTALDRELQQAFDEIPSFLRVVPMDLSITDSVELIIRRLSLAVLFHKSRCILHRKYITNVRENAEFFYSKKAAIEASKELLQIQSDVHDATQPGGVLCKDQWIISSLAMHDLLLAAVITFLCLIQESTCDLGGQQIPDPQQAEMITALEKSCTIWSKTRGMSVDTRIAYSVLSNILKRSNSIFQCNNAKSGVCDDATDYDTGEHLSITLPTAGTTSSHNGGQYESDIIQFPSPTIQSNIDIGLMPLDLIGELGDTPMDFNWDVFDNRIRQTYANDQSSAEAYFQNFDSGEANDYHF